MQPRDRAYHVERARAELDAAYRAERTQIAAIHLRLCSLHMEQARETKARAGPGPDEELAWIERCAPLHRSSLAQAKPGLPRSRCGPIEVDKRSQSGPGQKKERSRVHAEA